MQMSKVPIIAGYKPLTTELGQKTARCESLRALLPYVEWDRFVTLAGSKSGLRVTLSYLGKLTSQEQHTRRSSRTFQH
jgi:hypothetical protein